MQQWVPFACLSSDKMFHAAVNNNILSICILAFVKRHALCTFSALIVRSYRIPLRYFRNGKIFDKTMCVFSVYKFVCNISQHNEEFKEILLYIKRGLHAKYLLFLSDVNEI